MYKEISGGVTAAKGFRAAGIHCGVKKGSTKRDLGLIVADCDCVAAGVFTRNRVKAACVTLTMDYISDGKARAAICNSGNANACAPDGHENAERMAKAVASVVGCDERDVIVCSTGVIGQRLNVEAIEKGVPAVYELLSKDGNDDMCEAILTTDTVKKECTVEIEIDGKTVTVGGICKGSGMIHPNMGTMLGFITTDVAISHEMLKKALSEITEATFNRVSVDGDTSTNDTCTVMASGLAKNTPITSECADYDRFYTALYAVMLSLARAIARDGEGATKLLTCTVSGTSTQEKADNLSKAVITSSLTKAAMFGADANWGRVLCAMGYSGEEFDPEQVDVSFVSQAGEVKVCEYGRALPFDEGVAKKVLSESEIIIKIILREGTHDGYAFGCDLTYDYVKINGDYRT